MHARLLQRVYSLELVATFASISIERVKYKRWIYRFHLNKGEFELVVVPQIGRIMH